MRQNILYKIYMGHRCVYIDTTDIDLTATLRVRFFEKETNLDLERVSKIEYVVLPSQADCFVYKSYLVNGLKPIYNKSDGARDKLSSDIVLPELKFILYSNPIVDKWKSMLKTEQLDLFKQI